MSTPSNPGNLFSTYGYAKQNAGGILAAIALQQAAQTNEPLPGNLSLVTIVDSINDPNPANRDYAANFSVPPPTSWPPVDSYTSIFELKGWFMIGSVAILIQQTLGPFGARQFSPDQAQGDKNFIQIGHGANTVDSPVAGTAVGLQFLPSNIAQAFYEAPATA